MLSRCFFSTIMYVMVARSNIGNVFTIQPLPKAFRVYSSKHRSRSFTDFDDSVLTRKEQGNIIKCISWPTISSTVTSRLKMASSFCRSLCGGASSRYAIFLSRTAVRRIFRPAKMCLSSRVVVLAVCASDDWFEKHLVLLSLLLKLLTKILLANRSFVCRENCKCKKVRADWLWCIIGYRSGTLCHWLRTYRIS